jgi:hypothetical protein
MPTETQVRHGVPIDDALRCESSFFQSRWAAITQLLFAADSAASRCRITRARRSNATPGMPCREHSCLVAAGDVVHMAASALEQNPTRTGNRRLPIPPAYMGAWPIISNDAASCEQVGGGGAVNAPPGRRSSTPSRTSAKATIRTRAGGLPTTGVATNERGRTHQCHLGPPAPHGRSDARDLHRRRRRRPWVSIQIGGQRSLDCALGLHGRRPLRVHGQPSHVCAEHARILTFDDNWKMRCHYITPASRKIRLPSLPAS